MTAGQVEMKRTGQLAKARSDLDQAESQGVELDPGSVADGLDQPGTQGIQQPVGRGVHEQTEGVGPEAVVAQPVCFDSVFEVFQPVLGFAAIHVPVVDGQRVLAACGDNKPRIWSFAEDFSFIDHAA